MFSSGNNAGAGMIGQYYSYVEGDARNRAISVPTISRARDLMASVLGCMSLKMYSELWNGDDMEKIPLAPELGYARLTHNYQIILLCHGHLTICFFTAAHFGT
jgi:hypothetical protein